MRWRNGLLTASSALLLTACGGGHQAAPAPPAPRIPAGVAAKLAAEADSVAALTPGTCEARDAAAQFRDDVIASIGRIPPRWREPLASAANSLAVRLQACDAPKPVVRPRKEARHHRRHEKHDKHEGER
jgi:hypothetical protein